MLTYALKKSPGVPLYEALYRCIRSDILRGDLKPGQKLPSKRTLAANLEVSRITVETAYDQLLSEGYIRSVQKVGYFVEAVERQEAGSPIAAEPEVQPEKPLLDLTGGTGHFPFSVWSRLQREVMLDYGEKLLLPIPNQGIFELRLAISEHLSAFRGMQVSPENILIGAGTDFLCNLLIQLLGRDKIYALEEPGYGKIRKIYTSGGVTCQSAPLDRMGVLPQGLVEADILHFSPSHHFPSGLVTPVGRRLELLEWATAQPGRYIIEDDYDSEFRFDAHPMPTMKGLDHSGRVIYMNTFSKTLAPSIRISYLVLPPELMERFRRELGFYSCTVPSFEQYTLARFLSLGHFEKHINRMRKAYRTTRNAVVTVLKECPYGERFTILEQNAGLHFILKIDSGKTDRELAALCEAAGIRVRALGDYFHSEKPADTHCLVVNYGGIKNEDVAILADILNKLVI
jgi:GntR family transcriptional regulator/MocR family aminotransferase